MTTEAIGYEAGLSAEVKARLDEPLVSIGRVFRPVIATVFSPPSA